VLISQQLCADEDVGVQDGGMVEDLLLWWSSVDCVRLWSPRRGVLLGRCRREGDQVSADWLTKITVSPGGGEALQVYSCRITVNGGKGVSVCPGWQIHLLL
jgi:hypothetical protein